MVRRICSVISLRNSDGIDTVTGAVPLLLDSRKA